MALPAKAAPAAKKPAAVAAKPKAAAPAAEKVKKPGIGDFIKTQILAGKDNEKILELVLTKFPDANTTNASVNWYRSKLRQEGEDVPSSRKPKAEKAAAPAKKAAAAPAKGAVAKKPAAKAKGDDEGGF